nr:uncharacterized protein LOC111995777 [Quercus suber]
MTAFDREFEKEIKEAGNTLLNPPPSIDDLLTLLDKVENLLAYVVQEPSKSMQDALLPSVKALITNKLLRHAEMDVKHLKMSHMYTRSYKKVVSILDTIAKVKLCLVMLDLECNALVVEMFQSFLKIIRSNYQPAVLPAMEAIMNLVIDESEDISLDLLSSLFASVRKENQNVSPMSWKLGEQIIIRINAQLEKIMAHTQKQCSKLEGAHDMKVEVVECAFDQPSMVLGDLHLGEVKKIFLFPVLPKVIPNLVLLVSI